MKRLNFQSIFCFVSFLFLLSCCIFYGTRFVKLYLANEEEKKIEKNSLVKVIKESNENNNNFKEINDNLYFINNADNNYLKYSNIMWRIIKINEDNSITAISNNSLTSLAFGENTDISKSNILKWLNKTEEDYSGILEKELNNPHVYLQKTNICLDEIDNINNNPCTNTNNDNYISLLSTIDFANMGNKNSYVINDEFFYLENTNSEKEVWTVTDEGKVTTSIGNEIMGIRPVITIIPNVDYVNGNGKIDNPYTIENENSLFGSYVKLGNDLWQIYEVNDDFVRLSLNDYLKVNNEIYTHSYSSKNSYHNDTTYGTLAYYLNRNYLNLLSYKNLIKEKKWPNGYYNNENNYDYTNSLNKEVDTKVALMSIGNIFLNKELNNYFTMSGTSDNSPELYTIQKNQKVYTKSIQTSAKIVPTISIDKDILKKGNGTIESPYEVE